MKPLIFILIIIFLYPVPEAFSQEVLLEKEVELPQRTDFGRNSLRFSHFYLGYGFPAGPSGFEGADIRYIRSRQLVAGRRYKYKFTEILSGGYDLEYRKTSFDLDQNPGKIFPNNRLHEKELLILHQAVAGLYFRINSGKRGDYMGTFIDLGADAAWLVEGKHVVFDTGIDPAYEAVRSKTVYKKLKYLNSFFYGANARVGWKRYLLTVRYRLSTLTGKDYPAYPDFPRWTYGLQIGIY
ncbi:MAG: hypothetical protein ACP5D1_01230 [Bacteroidales bacterium]